MKQTAQVARIRSATERRAKEQAKRIPWPALAKAVDEYTKWQVFALWVRATADGSHSILAEVQSEIERRAPATVRALQAKVKSAIAHGARPGTVAWEEVICWAEMNVFSRSQAWRLVGRSPVFLCYVAAFDEGMVMLGASRSGLALVTTSPDSDAPGMEAHGGSGDATLECGVICATRS